MIDKYNKDDIRIQSLLLATINESEQQKALLYIE